MMIEKLKAIRANAEQQDAALTRLLAQRARYPLESELYSQRAHLILQKDSCLCRYMADVYLPILERISQQRKIRKQDLDRVVRLDRTIALAIMRRTGEIGEAVAEYKYPRGLPIYVPEVEEKKVQARIAQAKKEKLGLTEAQARAISELIIQETKRIEEIVIQLGNFQATNGIRSVTTDWEGMIEITKRELELEGEKLGGQHSVGIVRSAYTPRFTLTLY